MEERNEGEERRLGEMGRQMRDRGWERSRSARGHVKKGGEIRRVRLIGDGGADRREQVLEGFRDDDVDGALAASTFHTNIINTGESQDYQPGQETEHQTC